jgi:hypothetical protein
VLDLGAYQPECLRVYRIILGYRAWHAQCVHYLSNTDLSHYTFNQALKIQAFLTYEKKAFFKKILTQQQKASVLLALTEELLIIEADTPEQRYQYLKHLKQILITRVEDRQAELQAPLNTEDQVLATLILGWTQQGTYQMGMLSSESVSRSLEEYPQLPILRERLSPEFQWGLNQATGTAFMGLSLYFSNWMGYSYQTAFALSQFMLAQQDILVMLGNTVDPYLGGLMRWDEIGLVEKEAILQWMSGLLVHCGLNIGGPMASIAAAYTAATAVGTLLAEGTEYMARYLGLSSANQQFVKAMAHMLGYSTTYVYGFKIIEGYLNPPETPSMPDQQALQLFGFENFKDISEKTVKSRYYTLARQTHPDRCPTDACLLEMEQLNEAYQILRKKLQ